MKASDELSCDPLFAYFYGLSAQGLVQINFPLL